MSEEKMYVSKFHIDDTDDSTYYLKDVDTLAYAKSLKQEMGSFQTQLSLIVSQLQALEQKFDNQEGEETPDTDTLTKTEVEDIAAQAATDALDSNQELKDIINKITNIIDQAADAYEDFTKAEEKIDSTIDYAKQAAESAASSKENSINVLSAISPIITDYAYSTTDISRNTKMLIEQYDSLNSVKTQAQATATSLIDGQEVSTSLIKKTSESLAKSSTTMSAQYGKNPSDSPLTTTLSRITSNVSQTATSWGAEVSSFSYQQASSDEGTQEKVNNALQEYEEALKAQEAAYKTLNDSTIAYNEAKQWQGYAQTLLNESQTIYDSIENDYGTVQNKITTTESEINEVATKITNCINKIDSLSGNKDTYRQELQDAVQVLVGLYGNGQVTDSSQALQIVNAKVAAIESTSDEVSVNIDTFLELLEQYGSALSSYLALASRGSYLSQALNALEEMKDTVDQDLQEANTLLETTSKAYNSALDALTLSADTLDKAANGLVVLQISATEVRQGEIVSYVNAVKESTVQYRRSLSAKYSDFVEAVRDYHDYTDYAASVDDSGNVTYKDGDVRFWFYSVDPSDCTDQEFVNRFSEEVSRKAYADYYYNTNTNRGFYWDSQQWVEIISQESGDTASKLLDAFKIAQNYSDIEDDSFRNLYFYDSGYYNASTKQLYSPKEYDDLTSKEKEKIKIVDKGFPTNYQLGDIWYSSIYANDITITKVVPYYLTYPYAAGVTTANSNSLETSSSVGNWVSDISMITYSGKLSESDTSNTAAPYLWYYCEITYSNGNTVKTQPIVAAYHNNNNMVLQIQPYILVTESASSSVNTSYTTNQIQNEDGTITTETIFDCDWQPINLSNNDPTETGESGWKFLNFGFNNPYLFTFVQIKESAANSSIMEDKSSAAIYIDSYAYNNGIMSAELEYSEYYPNAWVDCWVSQSRQISGSLNNIWEYVNSTIAQTNNEILSTVKHLAQLENDTFNLKSSGVDQTEDSVNIYAVQQQGKANAFYCETSATTQIKKCINQIPQGGTGFNPWEEIYSYEERTRVRLVQNNNLVIEADYPADASYYNEETKTLTYDPADSAKWNFTLGTIPSQITTYTESDYEIIFSNFLQNGKKINGRLVNTNITIKFTNSTDVYEPLIQLFDQDGQSEIMSPVPVAAYGEILNNYSSETTTDDDKSIDTNKIYNWENESLVNLTLHVPTNLDSTIKWYQTEEDVYATSDGYSLYLIGNPDINEETKYGYVYSLTISAAGEISEVKSLDKIYWEICDSSTMKKISNLKVDVDKIEAITEDTSIGLTKLVQNPSGFSLSINNAANRSDANVLHLPDAYNDSDINSYNGATTFPLGIVNLDWKKASTDEEDLANGIYNAPSLVSAGVDYYSFINANGGDSYITTYTNKTVSLKANLNYTIGCYVKSDDCQVEFYIGKPPSGAKADDAANNGVVDTNLNSAVEESGTLLLKATSNKVTGLDDGWTYCYATFQYDTEKYGLTTISGSDTYTGARLTFKFSSDTKAPYVITSLHVTCLDAAEATNNYININSKEGLILGDLAKTTKLGGKDELGANINLTVADSKLYNGITIADPGLKLRFGQDSIVNINAVSATTFRGYGLLNTGTYEDDAGITHNSYKVAPHKNRWVKITSQLAAPIGSNDEESRTLRSGGAPGVMVHNYTSTLGMYALDASSVVTKFGLKTKTDGSSIVNKEVVDSSGAITLARHDLGLITGTSFMITPTIRDNSRLSNNGSISFQSNAGDILAIPSSYSNSGNTGWMDGAVIYSGQHIYDSKARIHGLWGYAAYMLYADKNVKQGECVKFSTTITCTNTEGASYFPGAIREISFYHNPGNKNVFDNSHTANRSFVIMGYKINPVASYDKDTNNKWALSIYAQRISARKDYEKADENKCWPLARMEIMFFRRDWADTVPQFDGSWEQTAVARTDNTGLSDDGSDSDDDATYNDDDYMDEDDVYVEGEDEEEDDED